MPIFRSLFCASALFMSTARGQGCASEPAPAPAPELPPPPPCIDERCAPRPERLICLRWWYENAPAPSCIEWKIIWEDRCQCFERAAPRLDGGTP